VTSPPSTQVLEVTVEKKMGLKTSNFQTRGRVGAPSNKLEPTCGAQGKAKWGKGCQNFRTISIRREGAIGLRAVHHRLSENTVKRIRPAHTTQKNKKKKKKKNNKKKKQRKQKTKTNHHNTKKQKKTNHAKKKKKKDKTTKKKTPLLVHPQKRATSVSKKQPQNRPQS